MIVTNNSSEGCSYSYQEQVQKFMNFINNIRGSRGINKSRVNYIELDQSKNKHIYLIKFKKASSMIIQDL